MQYRQLVKEAEALSVLGYGCMRFPTRNGRIDEEKALAQMLYAYEQGVNYYDTAYPYHAGRSEVVLGKFIERYKLRDQVYIADKLPVFLINKPEQIQKFFKTQLDRLNTHYIDYYLMHMLDSLKTWQELKAMGVLAFIADKKASGAIRHVGFSFHGRPEEFIKILEDYDWDFCQIQYNYLDEYNQAGLAGLKRAAELGIGVVVMEPLRGGNLAAKAPTLVIDKFGTYKEKRTPADWALRWIFNHEDVAVVLSGMNVDAHIQENIRVASETTPSSMSPGELQIIEEVKSIYRDLMKVPCTGCNYCMPCPVNVDIPGTFTDYNNKFFFKDRQSQFHYLGRVVGFMGDGKSGADLCIDCGKCEQHCPQEIAIRQELKIAHKTLDHWLFRNVLSLATLFLRRGKKKATT